MGPLEKDCFKCKTSAPKSSYLFSGKVIGKSGVVISEIVAQS